jgi:hypothetical protein
VEREGTPLTWLRRYALFVAGMAVGATWLGVLEV